MRNGNGRFVAGASGNPGGRPRGLRQAHDLIEALTPELILLLVGIARDPDQPGRVRIAAVTALLDRRYGRPSRAPSELSLPLPGEAEPEASGPRSPLPPPGRGASRARLLAQHLF